MKLESSETKLTLSTFALFFILGSWNLWAATGDLKISGVQGEVEVQSVGSAAWSAGSKDQILSEGDRVKTGSGGFAVLEMAGYGRLNLASDTEVKVNKKQIQGKMIDAEIDIVVGSLQGELKKLPKGSNFKFKTPVSVAAVRGTSFLINVSQTGAVTTYVSSGQVSVESISTGQTTVVSSGQAVVATATGVQAMDPNSAEFAAVVQVYTTVVNLAVTVAPEATTAAPSGAEPAAAPAPTVDSQKVASPSA